MKKFLFAISAFALSAACTAGAQTGAIAEPAPPPVETTFAPPPAPYTTPVECAVLTTRTPNGVLFEAVASAGAPAEGSYEFVLTKNDRNGSSDISQGGAFDLAAGGSQSLGEAELNLERRSSYSARLVLWDADGEVCRAERRS